MSTTNDSTILYEKYFFLNKVYDNICFNKFSSYAVLLFLLLFKYHCIIYIEPIKNMFKI